MNKSLLTNLSAIILIAIAHFLPVGREQVMSVGFFAFSGAITNWLAVYMLFEKVPFLYGSGVVPNRFEEFKAGIKHLIMTQFFNQENIDRFFKQEEELIVNILDFDNILDAFDLDKLFNALVSSVMESSFGGMLSMFGGANALGALKEPFIAKTRKTILDMTKEEQFVSKLNDNIMNSHRQDGMLEKIDVIIDQRLDELTPTMVKEIIQEMIQQHLGWLVVWGGVLGGLIGLAMSFVK